MSSRRRSGPSGASSPSSQRRSIAIRCYAQVAANYTLERMREKENRVRPQLASERDPGRRSVRAGIADDWRNWLDEYTSSLIHRTTAETMRRVGYGEQT